MIAFVSQSEADQRALWVSALTVALGEPVVDFADLGEADRAEIDVAIVANPNVVELLELPALKWVQSVWAGVENLLADDRLSVPIVRLVDSNLAGAMAEAVLAWTLYLHRDMPAYRVQQVAHVWGELPYVPARSRTVGLLGLGELGIAAAQLLRGVGFDLVGWSRSQKSVDGVDCFSGASGLDAVLARADILVCLLPHTAETAGLLSGERLGKLPVGASIINFGRGSLIDLDALTVQLDKGHLSQGVLDVFDTEPLDAHSLLWDHPKLTILPHISAPTDMGSASAIVAKNISAYRKNGAVPDGVDRVQGY